MTRKVQISRETKKHICYTVALAVVIGLCVSFHKNIGFEREVPTTESDTIIEEFDISQTEVIAAEIAKAREHKARKPMKYALRDGEISPFDDLFRSYAKPIEWDWRLLAAIAYCESHFNPEAKSKNGACGIMQLMPRTAGNYGCVDSLLFDPESNIKAGSELLHDLERRLQKKGIDHDLVYFTIAGFHAGLGHIFDAIVMADSLGYNPVLWHDNVEECLKLKSDPEYYNLEYVRLGRFNGKITAAYIREVLDYFEAFCKATGGNPDKKTASEKKIKKQSVER